MVGISYQVGLCIYLGKRSVPICLILTFRCYLFVFSTTLDKEMVATTSSPQPVLEHHPAATSLELDQEEEDVKPPPSLIVELQPQEGLEQREQQHLVHVMQRSPSTSLSSVDIRMLSPSPIPRRDDFFRLESGERFRPACGGYDPQMLQMLKEEHNIILENQRKIGLYIQEKRDGLKRRQQLEEELLRAKIKVEKLKAIRLRRDLPEFNSL